MATLRQYILSVICIVAVCGVLQMLIQKGTTATLFKVITGLVVTITVFSPLIQEQVFGWGDQFNRMISDGTIAVSEGQSAAADLFMQRIKEQTESYILSKASDLDAEITVSVDLASDYPNSPVAVTVKGMISPYAKKQLAAVITRDLAIPEEKQKWIS